jgi:hypothetical protein
MPEATTELKVPDLLPLAANTIRNRLAVLETLSSMEGITKNVNRLISRERLELLSLAVDVVDEYRRLAGVNFV